jgi:hypothetical protein
MGAAAGLKDTAAQAVKDAYAKLKGLIRTRYPGVSIDQLEQQPTSKARQGVVGDDLERASNDPQIVALARELIAVIEKHAPDLSQAVGVRINEVEQAKMTFDNVIATQGTGVEITKMKGGEAHFGSVVTGTESAPAKKA